jgi:hypothetical protein
MFDLSFLPLNHSVLLPTLLPDLFICLNYLFTSNSPKNISSTPPQQLGGIGAFWTLAGAVALPTKSLNKAQFEHSARAYRIYPIAQKKSPTTAIVRGAGRFLLKPSS